MDRVGINAVFLQPRMGGIETYVRRLVPALLRVSPGIAIDLFLNPSGKALLAGEPWAGDVALVTSPVLGRRYTRALSELTVLGSIASRRSLDVLHSVALTGPLRTKPAHVLTIPDVIWLRDPDPAELATARLWRLVVPMVARRADRLLTYSDASRSEVADALSIALDRIDVVPLAADEELAATATSEQVLRERLGLGRGPIVLSTSALKVHKNLGRLVEAFAAERIPRDAVLVIPGNPTPHRAELASLAERLGIADRVVFPGWVSQGELEGLYAAATCFVFASTREGFGLPVLEAMGRGLPVACSATSALPEVAGDAAEYFDPLSTEAIAAALERLLGDPALRERLRGRGRSRAEQFTWDRTARETLETYRRAAAARR